jgi:hypothetical protein
VVTPTLAALASPWRPATLPTFATVVVSAETQVADVMTSFHRFILKIKRSRVIVGW